MIKYNLNIDTTQKGIAISPTFMGLFFEDINYGADGGLYAELVNNRSFEFGIFKDTFSTHDDYFYAWQVVGCDTSKLVYTQEAEMPIHPNNPHYLQVVVEQAGCGIANTGFGGIAVTKGENYDFSVWLRGKEYTGEIEVRIEGQDGQVYGKAVIQQGVLHKEWHKIEAVLSVDHTDANAKLVVLFNGVGTLHIDMVSLFPQNTWNNRKNGLRRDMVGMLKEIKPKFLRFPGGCIVEGKYLTNAYNWKETIGPVEERKMNWSRWEEWGDEPYNQTNGLGFYEYFLLSEDIGATPLPILNCGMSCQYQSAEVAADIEPYIQDALDLIEYANGDEHTVWGAKRIQAGHKEPFNLVYVGIGNEQWIDETKPNDQQYFSIYEVFRNRIKEKYPEIQLVTTSGPYPVGKEFEGAWDHIIEKSEEYIAQDKVYAELVDEHYYRTPEWFLTNHKRYDSYPRLQDGKSAKVFAGEYACHIDLGSVKTKPNNLFAALCEAAFITGMERNSDVVAMTSYAPLFCKTTNINWTPDLIWFNNTDVYGTPSYSVQKMYGNNMGTYTLKTEAIDPVYHIVSKDEEKGEIIIKMVNVQEERATVNIKITGEEVENVANGVILTSSSKNDRNTLEEQDKVEEQEFVLNDISGEFAYTMPAYSFVVLRVRTK